MVLIYRVFMIVLLFSITQAYSQDLFGQPHNTLGTGYSNGIAIADINGDGYPDVFISNGQNGAPTNVNYLYINNGDGTFTKSTTAGDLINDDYISGGCSWGDYDNDGDLDMVVGNAFTRAINPFVNYSKVTLYENDGSGVFTSANAPSLTPEQQISKSSASFVDYDNDSYLDVFVNNAKFSGPPATYDSLYHNNHDGTFTTILNNLTTTGKTARAGYSWADYDLDGDMDMVASSGAIVQDDVLWINTGSDFSKVVLDTNHTSEGVSWADIDNDGDLDIFFTNSGDDPAKPEKNVVLFNTDTGFVKDSLLGDLTVDRDLSEGATWGDFDNDGDLDVIVANSDSTTGDASRLYMNDGTGHFTENTDVIFPDSARFCYAVACADLDNDGDLDVIFGRDGKNQLYYNNANSLYQSNHWLEINLRGETANRTAIGAIVRLYAVINGSGKWLIRDVNSQTGRGSHNDYRLHFGLGDAEKVDTVRVYWPGTDRIVTYVDINVDQIITLNESDNPSALDDAPINPQGFALEQNYPNPFNPTTTIAYRLAKAGDVVLQIFNAQGQEVQRLNIGKQSQGKHQVVFHAGHLSSGVYYYRLNAGKAVQLTKKMILIK